ncbi:MAG: tRNA guanosine(34) transglycosylase Tgt [bacterium]|nr:tRNA guanosine(34) transglycosylase Tgt [bacterium]
MLKFTIDAKIPGGRGRAGTIETPHGTIETPAFIPVGTKATLKSLTPEQVRALGADAILANTYHLYLQPGPEILKKAGGLHKFMNWSRPTFTDSGGFQAFSLGAAWGKGISKLADEKKDASKQVDVVVSEMQESSGVGKYSSKGLKNTSPKLSESEEVGMMAKLDDDGVTFKSIIDGSTHRFTPESSVDIQHNIGADIIFAFDECISPHESYERQKEAIERTRLWAERCLSYHTSKNTEQALFGIVQGGRYEDLRKKSAENIGAMNFDGFGIGGSFDKDDIGIAVGWVVDNLTENKPRHLLGIGSEPIDLILGIENGIDTFDCVAPTRIARNGSAYTKLGRINLVNAQFVNDFTPIDSTCGCYTCTNYTRAYVAHLFRAKEMLAATLTSIHNLYFVVNLVKRARKAIVEGKWEEYKKKFLITNS